MRPTKTAAMHNCSQPTCWHTIQRKYGRNRKLAKPKVARSGTKTTNAKAYAAYLPIRKTGWRTRPQYSENASI
jgi:hypothetical protein